MQTLTYISGPPCSGKSVVRAGIAATFPNMETIVGDDYWNQNASFAFDDRVDRTNKMILEDAGMKTGSHLLLEWVPTSEDFCGKLRDICESQNRMFNQIVLYAEPVELRKRKVVRDGDEDIFVPDTERLKRLKEALVLDTTRLSESEVKTQCVEWLRARLGNDYRHG